MHEQRGLEIWFQNHQRIFIYGRNVEYLVQSQLYMFYIHNDLAWFSLGVV